MAEVKTEETLVVPCSIPVRNSPDSGKDPPVSDTKSNSENNEAETVPKAKRRKNCPSALEKHNSTFSFTFDTNSQTTLQSTPKFGSFNLVETPPRIDSCLPNIPVTEKKEEKE